MGKLSSADVLEMLITDMLGGNEVLKDSKEKVDEQFGSLENLNEKERSLVEYGYYYGIVTHSIVMSRRLQEKPDYSTKDMYEEYLKGMN